ncbi:MAG: hypothetical protein LAO04_21500 [Acidobacteriia bacterium]|nr:hypothetical protein [Terriglobia bacterium]
MVRMMGSFLKRRPHLQRPAQHRDLLGTQAPRRKLFERAEANAIGLAQGTVDRTGFGHAHLSVVEDQGRNVSWMGVTVADEATAFQKLENRCFKDPEILFRSTKVEDRLDMNTGTVLSCCQLK